MAIISKIVVILAVSSTVLGGTIPGQRAKRLHKVYRRDTPMTNETLASALIDTPLVFGTADPDLANPEASFLFSNSGYYALQRYVYNGMKLAGDSTTFENMYNRAQFESAVSNPGLYSLTQTTFVGINKHCTNFWTNTVGQMTYFAENISIFGREAAEVYRKMSGLLDVMAAVPVAKRATDPAWREALIDVHGWAGRLNKQMMTAKNQSLTLLNNINGFRGETIQDMGLIEKVDEHLKGADTDLFKRVADMDSEIVKLKEDADEAQKQHDKARDMIKEGPAYAWVFPIGTIVYLVMSKGWREEMEAATQRRNTALEKIKQTQANRATYVHVTSDLNALKLQTNSITQYIEEAVGLLGNASDSFAAMSASITALQTELESQAEATDPETIRPTWFSTNVFRASLNSSARHWEDIYIEAAAFKGTSAIQVVSTDHAASLYEKNAQKVFDTIGGGARMFRRYISGRYY